MECFYHKQSLSDKTITRLIIDSTDIKKQSQFNKWIQKHKLENTIDDIRFEIAYPFKNLNTFQNTNS